ncbi:MAG TPA: DinB family protein [Sphingobacteriaceae bacterium]
MLDALLKYTEIADRRVIDAMTAASPSEKALYLFSHILNAQHIWARRVLGEPPLYGVSELHPMEQFPAISSGNISDLWKVRSTIPGDRTVRYITSLGESFENTAADILYHVINHSTYHRAQIATDLRQSGIEPPVTDYIILKRQGLL